MNREPLSPFHPLIRRWFAERVGTPTDIQSQAWPVIAAGKHVLVTAPTGSGKTLTAFLWAINQLVTGNWQTGSVRVLYISPLKALNNDIRKNLLSPLESLQKVFSEAGEKFPDISVMTRSGDTPQDERRRITKRPPEILITTPEGLNIMLASAGARHLFTGIRTVIIDEVHAVAATKRGTHLVTAIDRIVRSSGEFQRIALSATVKPVEKIAEFTGGYIMHGTGADAYYGKRDVEIIRSSQKKKYSISVAFPDNARETMVDGSWWPALTAAFVRIINENKSTLLFGNSRRTVERVTRFINELEGSDLAWSHHGSLAREIRLVVEQKLKAGELKAIVATSSLELGIDIGDLDRVVLIGTPGSVMSSVQRIGRAGHGVGEESRGCIYPLHGRDFLDAAVMARAMADQDIESIRPVECPLDVLAQVVLSMTCTEEWDIDELYAFLKSSYPYRNLVRRQYELVLAMLEGRYADTRIRELSPRVSVDRVSNTVAAKQGTRYHLFLSGGTIPDRGQYDMRLLDTRARIGELDEEFVWERTIGETFTFGTGTWRIQDITHNDVLVVPAKKAPGIIPFWKGEEQNRDFHLSEKIGLFLKEADTSLDDEEFTRRLRDEFFMDSAASGELVSFLKLQRDTTSSDLPHRFNLLIEHVDDPEARADARQVVLHTLWGGRVNSPFAHALSQAWKEKYGYHLEMIYDNDCILLMLPHDFNPGDVFDLVTPLNIDDLLRRTMEGTGFFGARFRENAGRALLLPRGGFNKRMPLWMTRLRSRKLFDAITRYPDFPVLLETWRECLNDDYDLERVKLLLDEIADGRITLSECFTRTASPFTGGLVWKQTNKYMYQDDTPQGAGPSGLGDDLIREVLSSSHLRPSIPDELVALLEGKLQRTAPGYTPSTPRDLVDWIKERLIVPPGEWNILLAGIERDHGLDVNDLLRDCDRRLVFIMLPGADDKSVCAIENIRRIKRDFFPGDVKLFNIIHGADVFPDLPELAVNADELKQEVDPEAFLLQWLSYYGPVSRDFIRSVSGLDDELLTLLLDHLLEDGSVYIDRFREGAAAVEICETRNLETLLRMLRRSRREEFSALPASSLQLYLSLYMGPAAGYCSMDGLRDALEQLFAFPAPASAWEEYILPSRVRPYHTNWMDGLASESGLAWYGCGIKKTTFAFPEDRDLFSESVVKELSAEEGETCRLFPDARAVYFLRHS